MKLIFTLLWVLYAANAICQTTTQTEYFYMKRGYQQVDQNGVDVKSGYTAIILAEQSVGDQTMTFIEFKRNNGTNAGFIIKSLSMEKVVKGKGVQYYAIPAIGIEGGPDSYGWSDFMYDVSNMNANEKNILIAWLAAEKIRSAGK